VHSNARGAEIARVLRPAAVALVGSARDLSDRLELLASHAPSAVETPDGLVARRLAWIEDARGVLRAAIEGRPAPSERRWLPPWSAAAGHDGDVLEATFGVPSSEVADANGVFSTARLLATYRLRLPALQRTCDSVLSLVGEQPPTVFEAVGLVRDLVTSASPFVVLSAGRQIRRMFLDSVALDPDRAAQAFVRSWENYEAESSAFDRMTDRLRRAASAETDRDRCIALLEAYKHLAEGLTRRWIWSLLGLTGLEGDAPTIGQLADPAVARLGDVGTRFAGALLLAARNAEAHDEFEFDEVAGVLRTGEHILTEEQLRHALTELDVLQRAWKIGRACALADAPVLSDAAKARLTKASARFRSDAASHRFGHAGQAVRSFRRNRDRVEIELDSLRAETCNPCFVALVQSAALLPEVSRFVVRVRGHAEPIIDLPSTVLRQNWPVFELAAHLFPHGLPQSTFLPSEIWARLICDPLDEATRVAAWLVLNDALHAVNDADADATEALLLNGRFRVVVAAGLATIAVLPKGLHLKPLEQAIRAVRGAALGLSGSRRDSTDNFVINRMSRLRDQLGAVPAILPTLDRAPLTESSYPHSIS
jgi:hypothetical protein